jgi:hypothetical protein
MPNPARKEKKVKATRAPTAYTTFFKANYESVKDLPAADRFKAWATKWVAQK